MEATIEEDHDGKKCSGIDLVKIGSLIYQIIHVRCNSCNYLSYQFTLDSNFEVLGKKNDENEWFNYYKKCKKCLSEEGVINIVEEGIAYNFEDAANSTSTAIAILDCNGVHPVDVQYEGSWKAHTRFGTRDIIAEDFRDFYYSWKVGEELCVVKIIMRSVSDDDDDDDVEDGQPTKKKKENDDEEDED